MIKAVTLEETLPLRQKHLRPSLELGQCRLPEDDGPNARHFGAFQDNNLVGVCSIYLEAFPNTYKSQAWRLRMMATEDSVRHQGYGKALVKAAEDYSREQSGELIWCNARASAISFYEVMGFKIEGDVFEIAGIGPHLVMFKTL